jgi:pimeloyl-ACP methyl ester carboxylesterase
MMDPVSQGVYYDPVELLSLDNTKLEGWLVPVMNAHRVIVEGTDILHKKSAAVVLVHDFAASRQQVLPLVAPLHEAGYVVLAINLRGRGPSAGIGSTFGLNEAQDVRAAVELLRRRTYVDPEAIAVLGIGTGASAALIAAEQDARIKVLILDHPVRQFQDVLSDRIGPRQPWLSWVRPLCKWTFEIAYRVDADDVNLSRFKFLLTQRPSLTLDEPGEFVSCVKAEHRKEIIAFLKKNLIAHNKAAVTTLLQKETVGHVDRPAPVELPGSTESWPPQRSATELLERSKATGW